MAYPTPLVDKEDVKAQLGISGEDSDTFIEAQIAVYVAQLERLTGRKFGKTTSFTEKGTQTMGQKRLTVKKYLPLTTVIEVKIDGEVIDPVNYEIELASTGFIRFKRGVWPHTEWGRGRSINAYAYQAEYLYEVEYAGGEDLPADVYQAIIDCVVGVFNSQGVDSNISAIKVGDASTTFGSRTASGNPATFENVVRAYRRVEVL